MLKLELGKYYKDRFGKVWGPITRTPPGHSFARTHPFHAGGHTFREDGTFGMLEGEKTPSDLVEEWKPEPTLSALPAETPWYPNDSGGWIEHDGKGCPVPPDTEVHVLMATERKNKQGLVTCCVNSAEDWGSAWCNDGPNSIVAYKLAKPKPAPTPQAAPKPTPTTTTASSGRIARYFVISREGVVYCYTSLRAAQKAARGFAIAAPGRPYTIAVFVETVSSKVR